MSTVCFVFAAVIALAGIFMAACAAVFRALDDGEAEWVFIWIAFIALLSMVVQAILIK